MARLWAMAGKKKKMKKFRAVQAVKEMARERIGTVPPAKVVPESKKKTSEKHKKTLEQMLRETDL